MTEWRFIPKFPRYMVSDDGQVYSYVSNRVLAPSITKLGYTGYTLWATGSPKPTRVIVGRLILMGFVGPPFEGAQAAHKNGVRSDNRLENLEWKTCRDNHLDKREHGTAKFGERSNLSRISDADAVEAIRLYKTGDYTLKQVGDKFGVTAQAVWCIKEGRTRNGLH